MGQIGRRIFYDKATGNVIQDTGERSGSVVDTTIEQDIAVYPALAERYRDTFDVIELEYGQYAQDFATCTGYRVDVETGTLEFTYPDPNAPEEPPVYQKPLSEEVAALKTDKEKLFQQVAEANGNFAAFTDFYFTKNPDQA